MRIWWLPLAVAVAGYAETPVDRTLSIPMPSSFREVSAAAGTTSLPVEVQQ